MEEYEKKARAVLKENVCLFARRGKGGYDIWHSPAAHKTFPVDTKVKIPSHGKPHNERGWHRLQALSNRAFILAVYSRDESPLFCCIV